MAYDLKKLALLIVDPSPGAASHWQQVCKGLGIETLHFVPSGSRLWQVLEAREFIPDVIFVAWDLTSGEKATDWIRRLRRDPQSPTPFLPVVAVIPGLTRDRAREALDAGVHGILVPPLSQQALQNRLREIIEKPRQFIRCDSYTGPDRRRVTRHSYAGPFRRASDRRR